MAIVNQRITLQSRPVGAPSWDNFRQESVTVELPKTPYVLIKVLTISIDPAMRGWMSSADSYLPPVAIGDVMRASAIGEVVQSTIDKYRVNDIVEGVFGLQQYAVITDPEQIGLVKSSFDLPISAWLSILGITGLTAYFGLLKVGQPQPGDTVLISAAAGATGSIVGQIAKLMHCRVVGVAGSDEKCKLLVNDFKFDAAINYKSVTSLTAEVHRLCPAGVDVFFDSVGGGILDAALSNLRLGARVVICGAISQYNAQKVTGPEKYLNLLVKRARMQGFIVFDYAKEYGTARSRLAEWVRNGLITYNVDEMHGLDNWIPALSSVFLGNNSGKMVLKLSDPKIESKF
uniref:Enoyl reductase (ER) domain-containing protein n=1 Tax=Spongospora subterranea TaxID=70186 RepID=A0A0H5R4L7_9EUKA|eukprot:CRZ09140.1 hypothetical protein [Spongospora subterranea]